MVAPSILIEGVEGHDNKEGQQLSILHIFIEKILKNYPFKQLVDLYGLFLQISRSRSTAGFSASSPRQEQIWQRKGEGRS